MAESLGTIRGQMTLDVKQALTSYTAARKAHISTVTALHTGAGAMIQAGVGITAVGTAMVGGLLAAVSAAAQFEKKLDFFAAVSGATQKEYEAVSAKALQLGQDTVYSATQIADSFIELGKSGIKAKDIVDGVGAAVAYLGAAADIPLDTAANIITAAVATFSLGAGQAVKVADLLAGAANASTVDVQDLGLSLKYAGGTAASLGIPFKDVNVALALLGKYGIRGSTAGTTLRTMLLSLQGATPKATAVLRDLGIITKDGANKFFDAQGKIKPMSQILQVLQDATSGLSDAQKTNAFRVVFLKTAMSGVIDLAKEGSAGFDKFASAIDKVSAGDVAAKRLDNLAGDIEILRGNLDTLAVQAGGSFQMLARDVVQSITKMLQSFSDLPKGFQSTILKVLGVVGIILILVGTFGILAGGILNIIALTIQMKLAFGFIKGVLLAYRASIIAATVAQTGFNVALIANPIGLVVLAIAAIVAAIVALIVYYKEITNFIANNPWVKFVAPFLGILGLILVFIPTLIQKFQELWPAIQVVWENITKFIGEAVTNISNFFAQVPTMLHSFFVQPFIDAFNNIQSFITTVWTAITTGIQNFVTSASAFFAALPSNILAFFTALPGMIGYALGFLLGTIVRWVILIGTFLVTSFFNMVNSVTAFFYALPGNIASFFTLIYTNIVNAVTLTFTWLLTNVPLIISNVVNFFRDLPTNIIVFFVQLYTGAVIWFNQLRNNVIRIAAEIFNGIVQWVRGIPAAVVTFFQQVVTNVTNTFNQARNKAIEIALGIYNGIRDAINGIPALVGGIFKNVFDAISGLVRRAFNAMRDFAAGLWKGFKDGLGIHSPSYIEHAMWAITGVIDDETKNLRKQVRVIQGLGNGISEVGNNLGNGFGNNLSAGMTDLYAQVAAANGLQASVALGTTGLPSGVGAVTPTDALASISDSLATIKDNVGAPTYDILITNPSAEPASTSLPSAIRKTSYMND